MSWIRELKKMIRDIFRIESEKIHTSIPAQVVSYDDRKNTCAIQLCVKVFRPDKVDEGESELPVLEDIPVVFAGNGDVFLSCPVKKDSYGVYEVAEDDINQWLDQGGIVSPVSIDRFNLDTGFFKPSVPWMFESFGAVATDRISMRTRDGSAEISVIENGTIEIKSTSGNIIFNGDSDAVALASKVDDFISSLDTVFRSTWVPPLSPDSGNALKAAYTAAFLAPPETVESEKVKVES